MTTTDKLNLMKDINSRNEQRTIDYSTMQREALVQLIEKLRPHVLTIDEVLYGDECWLEVANDKYSCGYVDCYITDTPLYIEAWKCYKPGYQGPEYLPMNQYGITWRCWTHRPDEATRKAATWVKSE